MRKFFFLFGPAILGALAFGAMAAVSASATPTFLLAEWLLNGVGITVATNTSAPGELTLTDKNTGVSILCSVSLDASINAGGTGSVSRLLTLGTVEVTEAAPLLCVGNLLCPEPLVVAVNLPWITELELMEENTEVFYAVLIVNGGSGEPGWKIDCMNGIAPVTCTGTMVAEVMNGGSTPTALFAEAFAELAEVKLLSCNGTAEVGEVNGELLIEDIEGGELSASSF